MWEEENHVLVLPLPSMALRQNKFKAWQQRKLVKSVLLINFLPLSQHRLIEAKGWRQVSPNPVGRSDGIRQDDRKWL